MKFGVSLFGHYPKNLPSPENFDTFLRMGRQARDSGFDLVHAGHHFMVRDFQKFQVIPALARVSAELSENMLMSVLDLATLNNPIRIAEEIATMDAMTNGRIVFTPALGYVDHDFQTFNVPKKQRRSRYLEIIDIVKRLWTEDNVNYDGKYFQLHDVTINPKPVQTPRPPIWQPADAMAGVIRAAEYGDVWLISNHGRLEEVKEQLDAYREHYRDPGPFNDHGIRLPMMRICSLGDTFDDAMKVGRPYVEATWKSFYGQFGQAAEMDNPDDFTQDFDTLWKDRFVFGTPDDAIAMFERFERELGVDLFLLSMPGSAEEKIRSIKMMGDHVIPHFKRKSTT